MTQIPSAEYAKTEELVGRATDPAFSGTGRCRNGYAAKAAPAIFPNVTLLPDRDPETFAIIGAAMEVHRYLGMGFLEAVYVEALHYELTDRDIPFAAEVILPITFKDRRLMTRYRADMVCYGQVIVELKALREVGGPEMAQVLNYLKASGLTRGLLLNFGTPQLTYRRFIWSGDKIRR